MNLAQWLLVEELLKPEQTEQKEERRKEVKTGEEVREGVEVEKNSLRVQLGGERRMMVKWGRVILLCYCYWWLCPLNHPVGYRCTVHSICCNVCKETWSHSCSITRHDSYSLVSITHNRTDLKLLNFVLFYNRNFGGILFHHFMVSKFLNSVPRIKIG